MAIPYYMETIGVWTPAHVLLLFLHLLTFLTSDGHPVSSSYNPRLKLPFRGQQTVISLQFRVLENVSKYETYQRSQMIELNFQSTRVSYTLQPRDLEVYLTPPEI